jgi:pimeloyl-ACP methyl ester carboxylesterase
MPVGADFGGQVTCEFLHRTFDGQTEKAQARLFLPPQVRLDPNARVPLVHNAGYEIDAAAAAGLVAKGWVVSTPHAHPRNPLDRGPNLDIALLHAARALPCVDDAKVLIQGGSAGGYMTLMLAAETFPLISATPMVPPVNWGYNAAYFIHNRALATAIPPGGETPAMPVLTAVVTLAESGRKTMGDDTDADSWLMSSPISQLESITAPVQVVWSTGDMLVPADQVAAQFLRAPKPGVYPDGFTSSITALMKRPRTRATLLDLLPKSAYETFLVPVPAGAPSLTDGKPLTGTAPALELPFSKDRVWSIVVVDEGPPVPAAGHFCYWSNPNYEPFMKWALARGIAADQLTVPKLTRLMMRLQGKEYRPVTSRPEGAEAPVNVVRLDFPAAERQDVLRGLIAFAADNTRAQRLATCYAQLPAGLKALGPSLGGTPEAVRAALDKALGAGTPH